MTKQQIEAIVALLQAIESRLRTIEVILAAAARPRETEVEWAEPPHP